MREGEQIETCDLKSRPRVLTRATEKREKRCVNSGTLKQNLTSFAIYFLSLSRGIKLGDETVILLKFEQPIITYGLLSINLQINVGRK